MSHSDDAPGDGRGSTDATAAADRVASDCSTGASRRSFVRGTAGASALAFGGATAVGSATAQSASTDYNLADALQTSLFFLDANECGDDVTGGRLEWRGDCHVSDAEVPIEAPPEESGTNIPSDYYEEHRDVIDPEGTGTVDVTGGYHDAGDHVKFGLPQSFTASTLAWAVDEFGESFADIDRDGHVYDHLRGFGEYYLNCLYRDDDGSVVAFCHQVGKGGSDWDHNYWGPAELQTPEVSTRPALFATPETPASDESAAAAAALAAIGVAFEGRDDDYAEECTDAAAALYEFANEYRGINDWSGSHYESSGDDRHLAWAGTWLYDATGEEGYLEDVLGEDGGTFTGHVSEFVTQRSDTWSNNWVHSWDDPRGGLTLKLATLTDDEFWWDLTAYNMAFWSDGAIEFPWGGSSVTYTPAGFAVVDTWGSARYNAAAQFCGLVYHKHRDAPELADWALGQMEYIMGDNPFDYSLIVGFTDSHAEHPHHDTAHGSVTGELDDPPEHRHTLYGALVGGPDATDNHNDATDDYQLNEVAIDFNVGLISALAGHYEVFGGEGEPRDPFPPADEHEGDDAEFAVEAELGGNDGSRIDVSAYLWVAPFHPARYVEDVRLRYYFTLGEGASPSDVEVDVTYDQIGTEEDAPVSVNGPSEWDGEDGVYYVEFDYGDAAVHGEYELSFALQAYGVDGFDPSTDPSFEGIPETRGPAETLPLYAEGSFVAGVQPDGTEPDEPDPEPGCEEFGGFSACDLDDDALHRDFDGDGELTTADVSEFQSHLFSDGVQENPDAFNFAGGDSVSHGDVIALFQEAAGLL